ncbi:MAG: hypothetical protein CBD21_04475 [bacterium TMED161]|nr:MAG: hypothetical protein CBD21_04475 [bacterium TMED161]|tara:strand:- start:15014 stop:17089 length:2076 start_codon:yes stop_codon:yes gene_type:complete
MLKYSFIANIILSLSYGAIINVGSEEIYDFNTIQDGVDNAQIGDTVLVHPGTYYENVIVDKTITLASLAIFDDLNNWYDYNDSSNQFEVINHNINSTIIDGSYAQFNMGAFGSADIADYIGSSIFVGSFNEECISPLIIGFTIQNGKGTMTEGPQWYGYYKKKGGGIYSYLSNASINYNNFINNGSLGIDIEYGGAIYFQTDPLENYIGGNNFSQLADCQVSEINIQNNFYNNNFSKFANTFSSGNFNGDIHIENSLFDVFNCSDSTFTKLWFDNIPEAEIFNSGIQANQCSFNDDLWVAPNGVDSPAHGSLESPLKTIRYALENLSTSLGNNITIHLDEGVYSPYQTGEMYSLNLLSNITLKGSGMNQTILDGGMLDFDPYEYSSTIAPNSLILINNCENIVFSDLSIVGGVYQAHNDPGSGAGINIYNSDLALINTNISAHYGCAISSVSSDLDIMNTIISRNNYGYFTSTGIELNNSNANLYNVTMTDNYGGGMYPEAINMDDSSYLNMINSIVWNNLYDTENLQIGSGFDYDFNGINILYSNIKGGWVGQGNISEDPLFVNPSQGIDEGNGFGWGWSPFGDYRLQSISPCIDTGIAFLELDNEIIINIDQSEFEGEAPDMGAIEYYEWNLGDINTDSTIDVLDIVSIVAFIIGNQEYTNEQYNLADYNQDGDVNVLDIVQLVDIILN